MHTHSAGPFGLQKLVLSHEVDIIQLRESILPVLTLGRGSDQEASSSGVSVCEDCPWIWGKIHVVEERRGRGETPRGSKAFLPPDSCLCNRGRSCREPRALRLFSLLSGLVPSQESPCFPGSALSGRHMMLPEWLIGCYTTGVSCGRNDHSAVAESCHQYFSAQFSLLFQLILDSVLVSIWETGYGSNSTLCSITSRHGRDKPGVQPVALRSMGRDHSNSGSGGARERGVQRCHQGTEPSWQPWHLAWARAF